MRAQKPRSQAVREMRGFLSEGSLTRTSIQEKIQANADVLAKLASGEAVVARPQVEVIYKGIPFDKLPDKIPTVSMCKLELLKLLLPSISNTVQFDLKLLYALFYEPDAGVRIKVYRTTCRCEPEQVVIEMLRHLQRAPDVSPPAEVAASLPALVSATTAKEAHAALQNVTGIACQGDFRFQIIDGVLMCATGANNIVFSPTTSNSGNLSKLSVIVLHNSGGGANNIGQLAKIYGGQDDLFKVSIHILITKDGGVFQFVRFNEAAWHAGNATWRGIHNLNKISIGISLATDVDRTSPIPSFFVAANLQPQIGNLIPRYSSCESCGTGFCVTIIADEGVSFQKPHFRSLDLTLKGQKVPKSGHF